MQDLIDFLINNPWLIILIIAGVLGNLGSSRSRQQQRQRPRPSTPPQQSQQSRPPQEEDEVWTEIEPLSSEPDEDDISRRLREVLGKPRAEPVRPVASAPPPARVERDRAPQLSDDFARIEALEESGTGPVAEFEAIEALTSAPLAPLEATQLGAEAGPALVLAGRDVRSSLAPLTAAQIDPRQAVLSMMLLGRPRSLESFDEDPSRGIY